jgi:hypothetical protein
LPHTHRHEDMRVCIINVHLKFPAWSLAMRHGTTPRQRAPTRARAPADRLTALVNLRGLPGCRLPLPVPSHVPSYVPSHVPLHVNNHRRVNQTTPLKSTRAAGLVGISSTIPRAARYAMGLHVRRVERDACRSPVASTWTERSAESTHRDQKALIRFQASPQTSDPTARRTHLTPEGSARNDDREWRSGRPPAGAGTAGDRLCDDVSVFHSLFGTMFGPWWV